MNLLSFSVPFVLKISGQEIQVSLEEILQLRDSLVTSFGPPECMGGWPVRLPERDAARECK